MDRSSYGTFKPRIIGAATKQLPRNSLYAIPDLGAVRAALRCGNLSRNGWCRRQTPNSLDQLVGEPAAYIQVSRETKGRRNRFRAVFQLPDQGSGIVSGGAPQTQPAADLHVVSMGHIASKSGGRPWRLRASPRPNTAGKIIGRPRANVIRP